MSLSQKLLVFPRLTRRASYLIAAFLTTFTFISFWILRERLYVPGVLESHIHPQPKHVFATLLTGPSGDGDWAKDNYFTGTRLLAYQLLHHPQTRSKIPFVVFVTENISKAKRNRLRLDGARIIQVDPIHSNWAKASEPRYAELLTKLRLWEYTEFDRICFLDSDIVLAKPLDGIFSEPAVALQKTAKNANHKEDEGALPESYLFAGTLETSMDHEYPPNTEKGDTTAYVNAGFLVFRPDKELFAYYMRVLQIPHRFDMKMMEQNLLNYAHRIEGNMPLHRLESTWITNFPKMKDVEGGVAAVHEKFWAPWHGEMASYLQSWRYRMEAYFQAMDETR